MDEVWSISTFASEAIAGVSPKPVYAFSLPIVEPRVVAEKGRSELCLPDGFMFLFCFDLLSIFERKNPLGLIDAFSRAFRPGEGPTLVIKVINGQFETGSLERLKWAAGERPDILVMDKYLDPATNAALMATCDSYVSLHRSEGFGLTLAEAMALGKPVIATGYSGNLDFMTAETSYLVPWVPGKVPVGCSPYPAGARWADPDLDAAAQIMRKVCESPSEAAKVGERARAHVLAKHGVDARAPFLRERFSTAQRDLDERLEQVTVAQPVQDAGPIVSRPSLVDIAAGRAPVDAPSNHPHLARAFRRFVWRLLQSHDDHDRDVRIQLAMALEGAFAQLSTLGNDVGRLAGELGQLDEETGELEEILREEMGKLDRLDSHVGRIDVALDSARDTQARVEELESHILARVEVLTRLISERQPAWDSDHRLHDTLLRRLTAIERTVRASESPVAAVQPDVPGIAMELRDFLGGEEGDDPESTKIQIGPLELQIPRWDTVILPWVLEYGEWEPQVGRVLQELASPGAVVIDIGAHVGIFTVPLSARVGESGRVVAVEADPINARYLRRNIARSQCDNVIVLEVAATDRTGTVQLSRSIEDNTGDSRSYDVPGAGQVIAVPGLALDDVIVGPVDLVKLDIQGTDHVAMRGMSRIIEQYHPTFVTEFWPDAIREYGDDPVQVLAWFRELGYSWSAIEAPDISDAQSNEEVCAAAAALPPGYCDLVLRPRRDDPGA